MAGGLLDFFRDEIARREMRQGLTDALNRGVVANTLGSVGDMAGLLGNAVRAGVGYAGHKMGLLSADRLPVLDEKPFLGSEWIGDKMRGAGMVSDRRNAPAELAATALGSVVPTQAPKIAAGLLQAQANAAAPKTLRSDQGAVVWHGSPHKFDKFDSSKIGTGEGAQAYGHGLYLAESPDVAKGYQNTLSSAQNRKFIDGTYRVVDDGGTFAVVKDIAEPVGATRNYVRQTEQISDGFPSRGHALSWLKKQGVDNMRIGAIEDGSIRQAKSIKEIPDGDPIAAWNGGSLYKVDLPDPAIARMLDWDKPLSQQHPDTALALEALREQARKTMPAIGEGDPLGRGIYTAAQAHRGGNQAAVSQQLRELGVPGIRYLDGGSRGTGTGTSNFVVFPGEEGLLQILERNGVPMR